MYTEYFQWRPTHNSNSEQKNVQAGQTLHGFLIYNPERDSYNLTQTVVETGASSYQEVKCQVYCYFRPRFLLSYGGRDSRPICAFASNINDSPHSFR